MVAVQDQGWTMVYMVYMLVQGCPILCLEDHHLVLRQTGAKPCRTPAEKSSIARRQHKVCFACWDKHGMLVAFGPATSALYQLDPAWISTEFMVVYAGFFSARTLALQD